MEDIALLLRGAIQARGNVLLKLNVAADKLAAVTDMLPALSSPTITTLARGNMNAVETVVPKRGVNTLIPALKAAGAQDILEIPISRSSSSREQYLASSDRPGAAGRRRRSRAAPPWDPHRPEPFWFTIGGAAVRRVLATRWELYEETRIRSSPLGEPSRELHRVLLGGHRIARTRLYAVPRLT